MVKWVLHFKRLVTVLVVFLTIGLFLALSPYILRPIFREEHINSILLVPLATRWGLYLLIEGILLIIFGGALGIGLTEKIATGRYTVNPAVTRDTRRHFQSREREQVRSGSIILLAGLILLALSLLFLTFVPF